MNDYNINQPLLSVGVACYNSAPYLERCLDSVLQQTYTNLEVIIVNDGSTDNSGEICDRYAKQDARVRVIHKQNAGLGASRNTFIDASEGTCLAFIDGDDYSDPDMYECMMGAILEHNADIAVCRYYIESEETARRTAPDIQNYEKRSVPVEILDKDRLLTCLVEEREEHVIQNAAWNKVYKKSLLNGLRFPEHNYEDIVYTTQLLSKVKKGCYIHTPLHHYIVSRQGSIMGAGVNRKILNEQLPAYNKRRDFLREIGREDLADTHEYQVLKKMLLLYTEARRSRDPEKRACMPGIAAVINGAKKDESRIYSCAIADPHEHLRFRLFELHPVFYNLFMDLNEGIVLPFRQRLRERRQRFVSIPAEERSR
ncbi:MAG: glycosyltransferase [Lachnospiraceae bacterium]|nr:glycosyltransferase [Lachnospiraceae bacterium]